MIYLAEITVDIRRCLRKDRFERIKQVIEVVYKEGAEKKKDSYFWQTLERRLSIRYDKKEDLKIISIEKIKPIGLHYE